MPNEIPPLRFDSCFGHEFPTSSGSSKVHVICTGMEALDRLAVYLNESDSPITLNISENPSDPIATTVSIVGREMVYSKDSVNERPAEYFVVRNEDYMNSIKGSLLQSKDIRCLTSEQQSQVLSFVEKALITSVLAEDKPCLGACSFKINKGQKHSFEIAKYSEEPALTKLEPSSKSWIASFLSLGLTKGLFSSQNFLYASQPSATVNFAYRSLDKSTRVTGNFNFSEYSGYEDFKRKNQELWTVPFEEKKVEEILDLAEAFAQTKVLSSFSLYPHFQPPVKEDLPCEIPRTKYKFAKNEEDIAKMRF